MDLLRVVVGWVAVAVVTLLGVSVLLLVYQGRIDLKYLIGDVNGDASMSRFQLLIFTFVIALSFLYLVTSPEAKGFPEVPANVLILLGISGSSYLVSKGIDRPNGADKPADNPDSLRPANGPSTP